MKASRRTLLASLLALASALGATALERALATWAPPTVWVEIALVNCAVALVLALSLVWVTRSRSKLQLGVLLGVSMAAVAAAIPMNVRGPGPVIWVVCDTLRADFMSLYGYPRETTPFFESWAPELVVFDQGYSQASHTLVTAPSLLASLHPSTHGLRHRNDALDPSAMLISEIMQEAGYSTFGVFSNPNIRRGSGFDQGWDHFGSTAGWNKVSSDRVNREFFRWRRKRIEKTPYFALLWYIDPHTPFQWDPEAAAWAGVNPAKTFTHRPDPKDESAPPAVRRKARQFYEASVRSVDNTLRRLVAFLRVQGDYEDALIVFTADHGESMWEHGRFGHNYGLYDHLTHVPLAIRFPAPLYFPDFVPRTGRSASIASSVDLLPTTLEFLGLPQGEAVQGRSVLSELVAPTGGMAYLEERLEHYGPYEIFGLREGRFKYIWIEQFEGDNRPRELLFDLESDPGEQQNLASERPEVAEEFRIRVMKRRRQYESVALGAGRATVDARTKALLEKLGYAESESPAEAPSGS